MYLFFHSCHYLSMYLSICFIDLFSSIYLFNLFMWCLFIHVIIYLSMYLFIIYLFIYAFVYYLFIYTPSLYKSWKSLKSHSCEENALPALPRAETGKTLTEPPWPRPRTCPLGKVLRTSALEAQRWEHGGKWRVQFTDSPWPTAMKEIVQLQRPKKKLTAACMHSTLFRAIKPIGFARSCIFYKHH